MDLGRGGSAWEGHGRVKINDTSRVNDTPAQVQHTAGGRNFLMKLKLILKMPRLHRYITRLAGDGAALIAAVRGSWAGTVDVVGMESAGEGEWGGGRVIFFPSAEVHPALPSIHMTLPGRMVLPRHTTLHRTTHHQIPPCRAVSRHATSCCPTSLCPIVLASPAGVLFDAAQYGPPMSASIDLAEPGPRAMPSLWSAILQGLTLMDPAQVFICPEGFKPERLSAWGV